MPAVAYAMSDMAPAADGNVPAGAVTVPTAQGGCGECHEATLDDNGRPVIKCDRCAPYLISSVYGYAATPNGVPLTCDEIADRELAERDAKASQNTLLRAMTDSFVKALSGGGGGGFQFAGQQAPPAKTLIEQLQELSDEEKAAVAAMLAPKPATAIEASPEDGDGGDAKKAKATAAKPAANRTGQSRTARSTRPAR